MYRNCIFCAANLGVNDAIEHFPVGRSVAFDAARGRLWAVCPRCARWNLAPIEERREAIEDAERLFRDTRSRVQRENVGLAKRPDGTRLIRIGQAGGRELATWRYGHRPVARRAPRLERTGERRLLRAAISLAMGGALLAGMPALIVPLTVGGYAVAGARLALHRRRERRIVHVMREDRTDPTRRILIRAEDLEGSRLSLPDDGEGVQLFLPYSRVSRRDIGTGEEWGRFYVTLRGGEAQRTLARVIVHVNPAGSASPTLAASVDMVERAGSADALLRQVARNNVLLNTTGPALLALEMALHEETERRALEGELAALEEMWRQAEEIAAIADRLPDDVPAAAPPGKG